MVPPVDVAAYSTNHALSYFYARMPTAIVCFEAAAPVARRWWRWSHEETGHKESASRRPAHVQLVARRDRSHAMPTAARGEGGTQGGRNTIEQNTTLRLTLSNTPPRAPPPIAPPCRARFRYAVACGGLSRLSRRPRSSAQLTVTDAADSANTPTHAMLTASMHVLWSALLCVRVCRSTEWPWPLVRSASGDEVE